MDRIYGRPPKHWHYDSIRNVRPSSAFASARPAAAAVPCCG